jgi:hypothetical protein
MTPGQTPEQTPEQTPSPVHPLPPTSPVTSGEGVAERHLIREVEQARRDLRLAQIGGALLTLFVLGYLGWITGTLTRSLEPQAAAQIAQGVIAERVEMHASDLSGQLKERVPAMIAGLPDYALKEMPRYREQLEDQAEGQMQTYFTQAATQMDGHMDDFLTSHHDQIKEVLAGGQDPATVHQLGAALQKEFLDYVNAASVNGETLGSKLDQSLSTLGKVRQRMDRLAENKGLTPQEKKARRAIALLSQSIEEKRGQQPIELPTGLPGA